MVALKTQKALDESKQNAAVVSATLIDDSRIFEMVIPAVCTGEALCIAVGDVLNEHIECVDVFMTHNGREITQKVWYSDDTFAAHGDVMIQVPIEFRDIILNVQMPSGVWCIECKRIDIVDTLLDAQIAKVYKQDGTCLVLDELRFCPSGYTVFAKHDSLI